METTSLTKFAKSRPNSGRSRQSAEIGVKAAEHGEFWPGVGPKFEKGVRRNTKQKKTQRGVSKSVGFATDECRSNVELLPNLCRDAVGSMLRAASACAKMRGPATQGAVEN